MPTAFVICCFLYLDAGLCIVFDCGTTFVTIQLTFTATLSINPCNIICSSQPDTKLIIGRKTSVKKVSSNLYLIHLHYFHPW